MMFLKWLKVVLSEFVRVHKADLIGIYAIYWVIAGLFYVLLSIVGINNDSSLYPFWRVFNPIATLTIGIPTVIVIVRGIGYWLVIGIYNLYLDYQHFAANGGNRKREDKQP